MERNLQKNGLINLLTLLVVGVAGFAVARYANSLGGLVSIVFLGVGFLVAAVSWFQMRLEESERLERLELDELAKGHSRAALFESKDSEMFPAQRSREQFERFFVPIFTAVLCIGQAAAAFFLWRSLSQPDVSVALKQPMAPMFVFGIVFFLSLFLLGRFSATMARLENNRLLRPGAGYMLLNAWLCLAVAVGIVVVAGGAVRADFYVARGLCVLLALTAVETLIALLLEMYRPRVKGKIERPLYESRLVGLLGQPEGLITTAAQALDYQFGFKVSETWFYRLFVEKALAVLVCLQIAALFLSTCVVFIEAGEQGLLERCGRPVLPPLNAGIHFKLPWPLDHVYRFRTQQIQSFEIGTTPEAEKTEGPIVLWTVAHSKEDNFLVANREPASAELTDTNNAIGSSRRTPPVSLVSGSIPVQYQITDLAAWAYNNEDAPSLFEDLATREVVRYLVGADMNEIMSYGRLEAAEQLRERIQVAADSQKLGAKVVSVGLQDLHPPVKVAPDYEKVIGAIHSKEAKILAARADEIKTNALAQAKATNVINVASANRTQKEIDALAQAALFTNQIPAYQAAPSVYIQRAYLQAFANSTANARKYILLTTNTHDVLQFDLQDKIRADILTDVGVQPAKK
jgi:regulator of protease activity HflC (stomatin/prohibitin superfamily)